VGEKRNVLGRSISDDLDRVEGRNQKIWPADKIKQEAKYRGGPTKCAIISQATENWKPV